MIYLYIFLVFLQAGLFGFGGSYSMLAILQNEVVTRFSWLTPEEFAQTVAVGHALPGFPAFNTAACMGYDIAFRAGYSGGMAVLGGVLAVMSMSIPTIVVVTVLLRIVLPRIHKIGVQTAVHVVYMALVGVYIASVLQLCKKDVFNYADGGLWHKAVAIVIFVATFVGVKVFHVHPLRMLLMAAFAGLLLLY